MFYSIYERYVAMNPIAGRLFGGMLLNNEMYGPQLDNFIK